jgi:predicted acetyltransferase
MTLKLEFPEEKHEQMYNKMIKEWWKFEKIPTSPTSLFNWKNFNDFLKITEQSVWNNQKWVNAHLFFLILNNEILWAIQIRHNINHPNLIEEWWHIWYWIAPKFRKNGYGTKMLSLGLKEAKKIWLKKALITCYINNIWSNKIIQNNWGVFERVTVDWDKNRYWIEV